MYKHQEKLSTITDIWSTHIYDNRFFESKFNVTEVTGNNYFGDLTTYFNDLESVIYNEEGNSLDKNFTRDFKNAISFLQAIFIQQDFVKEMLFIFNCNKARKEIYRDSNFMDNRDIRNELVGHPIKREFPKKTFESSAIFSNSLSTDKIAYLRYHKENAFKSQHIIIKREDIINRHKNFINYYFDIVIQKIKEALKDYQDKLNELRNSLNILSFENLLEELCSNYKSILQTERLFSPELLKEVLKKTGLHIRYKFSIEHFYKSVYESLSETITVLEEWMNWKIKDQNVDEPKIKYILLDGSEEGLLEASHSTVYRVLPDIEVENYNYEIGKLGNKQDFFINILKSKCSTNKDIIAELEHMEKNLNNDLEYYSAFCYLCKLLGKE